MKNPDLAELVEVIDNLSITEEQKATLLKLLAKVIGQIYIEAEQKTKDEN
jgi:hypothetical protein